MTDIDELTGVIHAYAESVRGIGDSIGNLSRYRNSGLNPARARRARDRLKDIAARLTIYSHGVSVPAKSMCAIISILPISL